MDDIVIQVWEVRRYCCGFLINILVHASQYAKAFDKTLEGLAKIVLETICNDCL